MQGDLEVCWPWLSAKDKDGYGLLYIGGGITRRAHRLVWEQTNGNIPKGLHVLHKCDNPECVNLNHLFLGTNKDNMQDRNLKGRQSIGVQTQPLKLTPEQVQEIRISYIPGVVTQTSIAKKFGITRSCVYQILTNKIWRNL